MVTQKKKYQIDGVIGSHLDVVVLLDVPPLESELAGLSVEVDVLDGDRQRRPDPITEKNSIEIPSLTK